MYVHKVWIGCEHMWWSSSYLFSFTAIWLFGYCHSIYSLSRSKVHTHTHATQINTQTWTSWEWLWHSKPFELDILAIYSYLDACTYNMLASVSSSFSLYFDELISIIIYFETLEITWIHSLSLFLHFIISLFSVNRKAQPNIHNFETRKDSTTKKINKRMRWMGLKIGWVVHLTMFPNKLRGAENEVVGRYEIMKWQKWAFVPFFRLWMLLKTISILFLFKFMIVGMVIGSS